MPQAQNTDPNVPPGYNPKSGAPSKESVEQAEKARQEIHDQELQAMKAQLEELKKQLDAKPQVQQTAESFKAALFAQALFDAGERQLDETMPGGLYRLGNTGQFVDANGVVVKVEGGNPKDVAHSGELREMRIAR